MVEATRGDGRQAGGPTAGDEAGRRGHTELHVIAVKRKRYLIFICGKDAGVMVVDEIDGFRLDQQTVVCTQMFGAAARRFEGPNDDHEDEYDEYDELPRQCRVYNSSDG